MMNLTKLPQSKYPKTLLNILKFIDKHQQNHKTFTLTDQSFNTKNMITSRELLLKKIVKDMKNGIKINNKQLRRSLRSLRMMKQMETTNES